MVWKISDINPEELKYAIHGFTNALKKDVQPDGGNIKVFPNPFHSYEKKFNFVLEQLQYGYSFLMPPD